MRVTACVNRLIFICSQAMSSTVKTSREECLNLWKKADVVCFDVDSTLLKDEGLDELAEFCGVGKQVKEWTNKAMGGNVRFRTALQERLEIIKPSLKQVQEFIQDHQLLFSPGVQEVISALHKRNVKVYLVSGGFRSLIEPAAKVLNIPIENVYANRMKFFANGEYAGFDESQPTSDSGGKTLVAKQLKEFSKCLVFIGDGVTDMEACPPGDCFIGFGGNVVREKVKAGASLFITDFAELLAELDS